MLSKRLFFAWSLLAVLWMTQLSLWSVLVALGMAFAWKVKGRFHLSHQVALLVAGTWGVVCFALARVHPVTGILIGPGALYAAVYFTGLAALSLSMKLTYDQRQVPLFLSASALIFSGMSVHIQQVVLLSVIGLLLLLSALREESQLPWSWRQRLWKIPTFALAVLLALAAAWSETRLGLLLSLFTFLPVSGVQFPPVSTLTSLQKWQSSDIVALRVYAEDPPLYLVGRTFYKFDQSQSWRWGATKELLEGEQRSEIQDLDDTPVFLYPPTQSLPDFDPSRPLRLEFPAGGSGFTLYAPRNYARLGTELPQLHRYSEGTTQVRALDYFSGAYLLYPPAAGWQKQGVVQALDDQTQEAALELPDTLTPLVAELAEKLTSHLESPRQKADAIVNFFHSEFSYGYGHPFSSPQTALQEFLEKKPPAHCEFFATSAALMLRSQGIPTRYLNGFVIQERSLNGEYYVVRLKHAHAWVEVYLPDEGWTPLDPTPPEALSDPNETPLIWSSLAEQAADLWRRILRSFSGSPTEILMRGLQRLKTLLSDPRSTAGVTLLFLGAGILAARKWLLRHRTRAGAASHGLKLDDPYWTPLLRKLQDRLAPEQRRASAQETLCEWYTRLSESVPDSEETVAFLKEYEAHRYRGSAQNDEAQKSRQMLVARFEGLLEKDL